ncbi:hypothetical protein BpHYR1_003972 [Brachionus plicatilis]|uniref:Uncharacterized protein n=1 Tax=Brachionus plicatilis TaxID=10195 RepID=A0A3M7RXU2_BRAPC|nr:hypothetical protein BpHYR1_003972 [Brachionus plicatilis]
MIGFKPIIRYFFCHLIQTRPLDLLYILRTNMIPSLTNTIKRIKFQTGLRDGGKFVGLTSCISLEFDSVTICQDKVENCYKINFDFRQICTIISQKYTFRRAIKFHTTFVKGSVYFENLIAIRITKNIIKRVTLLAVHTNP